MATTATRQRITARPTTLTARRSTSAFGRKDASPFKLIHVVVALHFEQAIGTRNKPLVDSLLNVVEEVDRITLVSIEDYSGFDVTPVDAPRCQIRRADIGNFSTAAVTKVNCLWVVEAISVAHDTKEGAGTRQPENVCCGWYRSLATELSLPRRVERNHPAVRPS